MKIVENTKITNLVQKKQQFWKYNNAESFFAFKCIDFENVKCALM